MKLFAVLALGVLLGCASALVLEGRSQAEKQLPELSSKPLVIRPISNDTASALGSGATQAEEKLPETEEAEDDVPEAPAAPAWTSTGPDSTDYNRETHVRQMPVSIETLIAAIYCILIASAPIMLAALSEEQLTRAHMLESVALIIWLGGALFMFTSVLKFQSLHWEGTRPLTLVEAVYLMSQILTTIGYGDITPAFPRGQVWVGINVIIALGLYGSIVMEVVGIIYERIQKKLARRAMRGAQEAPGAQPLKAWMTARHADKSHFIRSALFFTTCATVGVLFWHFYPGEGKTWLQAIYMSIITLSTVGFGAFNATTEAGKVFAAFWMLIGVASLGALVGSFIELMWLEKAAERHKSEDDFADFRRVLDACIGDKGKIDKATFLKVGLMLSKGTEMNSLESIERRFEHLAAGQQLIRRTTIVDEEGPPL